MMSKGVDLVEITVETHLGARYVFPDMPRESVDGLAHQIAWAETGNMVFVNVSGSALMVKTRIVKTVSYDGEVKWKNVAAVPELQDAS